MGKKTLDLNDRLYEYMLSVSLRETALQKTLREETDRLSMGMMQISSDQGQFMAMLIRLTGAKRALEIGTFTGYSTLAVAAALPEDGHLVACDISEEWTAIAQHYWREAGISHKIDLRLAPALTTLAGLKIESDADYFDFAFIDADKLNQLAYYEHSLRLVKPGGLIAIDNVLWGGSVADPVNQSEDTQAIRDFNKFVHQDQRVEITLVPIGDGLTLAWKKS